MGGGVGEALGVGVGVGDSVSPGAGGDAEVPGSGVGVSAGCAKGVGVGPGVLCARAKSTPARVKQMHNTPSKSPCRSKTQAIFAASAMDTAVASNVL